MRQSNQLVDALKLELKRANKTYSDLVPVLHLSHASIKRLFAEKNLSLARLDILCEFLEISFSDLVEEMEKQVERIDILTLEQELEFAKDSKFLCLAHALLNKWTFDEVIRTYEITEHQAIKYMAKLDKMRLIEMLPGNRYKLLISRNFSWITSGPIQNFFEKELQSDFFDSKFSKENEHRLYVSSMLSKSSMEIVRDRINKLALEINSLHASDEKLSLKEKRGVSAVLAFRPWETQVFTKLRRS